MDGLPDPLTCPECGTAAEAELCRACGAVVVDVDQDEDQERAAQWRELNDLGLLMLPPVGGRARTRGRGRGD